MMLALIVSMALNGQSAAPVRLASADSTVPPGTSENDRFAHLVYQGAMRDEAFAYSYQACSHGVGAMTFDSGAKGEKDAKDAFVACMYDYGYSGVPGEKN